MVFADRRAAARELAQKLALYAGRPDAVVLAIPRGGVVVGAVLADELGLPLDVVLTKKLGHPENPEWAIGVVDADTQYVDEELVRAHGIPRAYLVAEIARLRALIRERESLYRDARPRVPLAGKTVLICDDGVATGNTMLAAVSLALREGAKMVVAAAPVCDAQASVKIGALADEIVCVLEPDGLDAIGRYYRNFDQVDDAEALRLLRRSAPKRAV